MIHIPMVNKQRCSLAQNKADKEGNMSKNEGTADQSAKREIDRERDNERNEGKETERNGCK